MDSSGDTSARFAIWLVEDSVDYRQTVHDLINEQSDMECPHAFGSAEAMFDHLEEHFAPEIILMDIGLPGMTGIDAVERLRTISPATQVVMLTIHEDNDRIFSALCHGATGYLLKSESPVLLLRALRDVFAGGAPMTPKVARRVLSLFTQLNRPREEFGLTNREADVLKQLVEGKSKKGVAKALGLSPHTVDTHMRNLYAKLHVHSKSGAVAVALKRGLV